MENINIKVKFIIDEPEIIEFMNNNKPANSEKEGEENFEMYKYLMENVFKKPEVVQQIIEETVTTKTVTVVETVEKKEEVQENVEQKD